MSQHDFVIANQTANSARLDINSGLQALASNNSGDSEPSTTYANMWWYETDSNLLKIRNENDSAWINVAYVDQINSVYSVLDDTKLVNTSGAQTGLLGGQLASAWNAGTGTTESLVSPAQVASAIDALAFTSYDLNSDGYLVLGMGLEIVWGTFTTTTDEHETKTFHRAFTNECWGIANGGFTSAFTQSLTGSFLFASKILSKTQFLVDRDNTINGTATHSYIAWGK